MAKKQIFQASDLQDRTDLIKSILGNAAIYGIAKVVVTGGRKAVSEDKSQEAKGVNKLLMGASILVDMQEDTFSSKGFDGLDCEIVIIPRKKYPMISNGELGNALMTFVESGSPAMDCQGKYYPKAPILWKRPTKPIKTKVKPVLRITLSKKKSVLLEALKPSRFTLHGFGTFLENVKPGEISITQEALDALDRTFYKDGIQGLEIFGGSPILAWGDPRASIVVPLDAVSKHEDSDWFPKSCVIE